MLNKSAVQTINTETNVITILKGSQTYTVNYTDSTKIVRKYNKVAAETEIAVGDKLKVYGTIDGITVTAKKIKDLSIQQANGKFKGNVLSIDSTTSPKSFVLHTSNRGDRTITVNDDVKIKYKGKTKAFTDLDLRQRVLVVKGVWNTNTNTVYNVSKINITRW